jgi:hypothetical protein
MTSLSDTLTMGIVLALVFGSIVFYLYSRLLQVEKRMSLTENILLDLKMATENTLLSMGPGAFRGGVEDENEQNERVEPVSEPEPVPSQEVEELSEEDFYKTVLAGTLDTQLPEETETSESPVKEIQLNETLSGERGKQSPTVQVTKMEPNYESMSLKELKALAKEKGVTITSHAQKKEIISALKKGIQTVDAGSAASSSFPLEGAEILE